MSQFHVFDTYARSASGKIMHFDVILPENDPIKALQCARDWLRSVGEEDAVVNSENCAYCHSEPHAPAEMQKDIQTQGYAIFKLEGCPR